MTWIMTGTTLTSPAALAAGVYAAWTAATWLLEGLPQTLLRPPASGLRMLYAVAANVVVGLGGSAFVIATLARRHGIAAATAGFRSLRYTVLSVAAGAALGGAAYAAQSPPSRPVAVLINGFSQVLPVSAAEVAVCWALATAAIAAARPTVPTWRARALALVPGSVLFGLYHVAHSPPFNTPGMIVLLTAVGLLTGTFYLCTGEIMGTLVFHNFLALFGVLDALDRSGRMPLYQDVQPPLVLVAVVALAAAGAITRVLRSGAGLASSQRRCP